MGFFSSPNQFEVRERTVLVTGGSQGLGLEVGKQLAAKGANIVIVARDKFKLEKAIKEISSYSVSESQKFLHLSYDLTSPTSAPRIVSEVTTWNGQPPDILICCAAFCTPGFFASTSIETHRSQMDTVYWTSAQMAHAVLRVWIEPSNSQNRPTRHIVFTSSVVAFFALAGYAPYNPGKWALRALADTLNQEVAVYNGTRRSKQPGAPPADIKVHTIFPMGILSPGYENEQKIKPQLTLQLEKDDHPQTPREVARVSIARLEAGDYMITTHFTGHVLRGASLGCSMRNGVLDLFWNMLGTLAMLFVLPSYLSQCYNWGRSKGMAAAQ